VATTAPQIPRPAPPGGLAPEQTEIVEIVRWRGYATSAFYARRLSDDAVVATSPTFRWRKSAPPPDRGAARAAHDRLTAELREEGWHDAGSTRLWYEHRFEQARSQSRDVPAVELPPVVEEPPSASVAAPVPAIAVEPKDASDPQPPAAAATSGRSTGGRRTAIGLVFVVAILAGGAFAVHAGTSGGSTDTTVAKSIAAAQVVAAQTAAAKVAAPSPARLEVKGVGRGSWLEVRVGSAKGHVLFSGVVHDGGHRRFHAGRLWVMFGGATNLVVTVNGVRQRLQGTVEALVTDHGLTAP
jgi:hypothetical protein